VCRCSERRDDLGFEQNLPAHARTVCSLADERVRGAYLTPFEVVDLRDDFKQDAIRQNRFTADGLKATVHDFSIGLSARFEAAKNVIAKAEDRAAELRAYLSAS